MRFALFVAAMNASYKAVLCFLRRVIGSSDRINAPIAGFIAGLCCAIDGNKRRKFLLMMILPRLADSTYALSESRNLISSYKYGAIALWTIVNVTNMYVRAFEVDCMNDALRRGFDKLSFQNDGSTNYSILQEMMRLSNNDRIA